MDKPPLPNRRAAIKGGIAAYAPPAAFKRGLAVPCPMPTRRQQLEAAIERLIDLLDQLDGDPDFELETDLDLNPASLQAVDRVQAKRITRKAA